MALEVAFGAMPFFKLYAANNSTSNTKMNRLNLIQIKSNTDLGLTLGIAPS